jgi:hypothetical protein
VRELARAMKDTTFRPLPRAPRRHTRSRWRVPCS